MVTEPAAVTGAVLEAWAPALMGDLRTVPLRPWCDAAREFFDRAAAAVDAARDLASADWAAQARFGRRWFTNALLNLPAVERARLSIGPVASAIVTGAGPSLDRSAGRLPAERRGSLLAATDTSLPALLARGILPDLAISIDCQLYGYHHVMAGLPADLPLLLDLSSPPVLARSHRNVGFFASGHPLARWVSRHWRSLPDVDTSGGNVTHAAVSTVCALGAREVRLAGVDFSYPLGSPYARGTWLHPYFRSREDRCSPSEGRFFGMLVAAPGTVREAAPEGFRYTSPLMRGYRRSFEQFAGSLDAVILDDWCLGPDLQIRRGAGARPARWDGGFSMGPPRSGWRRMLGSYAALVAELPAPARPLASWWHGLEPGSPGSLADAPAPPARLRWRPHGRPGCAPRAREAVGAVAGFTLPCGRRRQRTPRMTRHGVHVPARPVVEQLAPGSPGVAGERHGSDSSPAEQAECSSTARSSAPASSMASSASMKRRSFTPVTHSTAFAPDPAGANP